MRAQLRPPNSIPNSFYWKLAGICFVVSAKQPSHSRNNTDFAFIA
jgi:hypothetical protein